MAMTRSRLSSISLISVSTASCPKLSLPSFFREYASSTKRTPPKAPSTAAKTFGAVCPLYSATRSARDTSSNTIFLLSALPSLAWMTPISTSSSPTMRATTVLPVPGFPRNCMWKDWPMSVLASGRRSFRQWSNATIACSSPIPALTLVRPTKLFSFSMSAATFAFVPGTRVSSTTCAASSFEGVLVAPGTCGVDGLRQGEAMLPYQPLLSSGSSASPLM
mmetsp:Transcript_125647/g.349941  ORF Transcript_125647/g.349941 Transcript_125647/m.349941 type:complete len:220 (+) Transcript_125647:2417-3076(+)